jgi:hypothetical protein
MNHIGFIAANVHLHTLKHTCIITDVIRAYSFSGQSFALVGGSGEIDDGNG